MLRTLFLFISLTFATQLCAQVISGVVYNAKDSSILENVHIVILGKKTGTITNQQGSFRVTADSNDRLVFSRLGFESMIINAQSAYAKKAFYMKEMVYVLPEVEASDRARIEAYKQKTIYRNPNQTKTPAIVEKEVPKIVEPGKSPEPSPINIFENIYEAFSDKAKAKKEYQKLVTWQQKVDYWRAFLDPKDLEDLWGLPKENQNLFWTHISAFPNLNFENELAFLQFLEEQSYPFSSWR